MFLEHPIGTRIGEGEGDNFGQYDYSHMLTPEHRAAGYQLVVNHDNDRGTLDVDINHNGNYVGGINSFLSDPYNSLVDPRQQHRAIEFHLSDLDDEHQGKGLGPAAYKAAIVHGKSLLGVTHVRGGDHSTQAHRVHQKLASELGVTYHAPQNKPTQEGYQGHNKQFGGYEYPLQPLKQSEPVPLIKAQLDSDFKSVVGALDSNGANLVDHTPHLKAHPPALEHGVNKYAQTFLYNPSIVRKVKSPKLGGISKKVVFDDGAGNSFMVKPYHERVARSVSKWMHRAHQGWAEMANQSLFHAAGIGHMHQAVHVAEHNMGPGHENEPGVVVHMQPHMNEIAEMAPSHYHETMLHDATKIAAMDYLANNLDRHGSNLLYRRPEKHDPMQQASRLLAIDHGRNFQYKSKTKFPQSELEMGAPKESLLEDNLSNYFTGAMSAISNHSANRGGPRISNMQHFVGTMQHWWPHVRDNVVSTMHQHVAAIKDQAQRSHIWKNFMERVGKLDEMVRFPDEYIDGGRELLNTPIWTHAESGNAYNPWQKEHY